VVSAVPCGKRVATDPDVVVDAFHVRLTWVELAEAWRPVGTEGRSCRQCRHSPPRMRGVVAAASKASTV